MSAASPTKRLYPEVVWFRGVAALTVVTIHALSRTDRLTPEVNLAAVLVPLMFATPVFVFISEYLFSRSYPEGLPEGFYRRRFKYLVLPYLSMGIAYAVYDNWAAPLPEIARAAAANIFLGQFVGYFVLVIVQFYLLHHLFHRHLKRWNPWIVLGVAFVINAAYLTFFNTVEQPPGLVGTYVWHRGFWLLAVGWIFYFALGYYAGRYRETLLAVIARRPAAVIGGSVAALGMLLVSLSTGAFGFVSSKRPDLLFYTPFIIALLALVALLVRRPPRFLLFISNYSFSIYLLHWFTVDNMPPPHAHPVLGTAGLIVVGLASSIATAKVVNLLPWGKYLVGRPYGQRQSDYAPADAAIRLDTDSEALGVPHSLGFGERENAHQ